MADENEKYKLVDKPDSGGPEPASGIGGLPSYGAVAENDAAASSSAAVGATAPPPPPHDAASAPPVGSVPGEGEEGQQPPVATAPPPYVPQQRENEVDVNELPPAYEDDVSCSAGFQRSQHRVCLFFTLGLFTVVLLRIVAALDGLPEPANTNLNNPATFWTIFAIVYMIYLIECSCSSTRAFTHNKTTQPEAVVEQVQNSPPSIRWHIQCYHYETRHRTRTVRDSNGNTRTEHYTERVRVNTHAATQYFAISQWRDGSANWLPPGHSLTKHHFYYAFSFTNAAIAQRYNMEKSLFIATNNRDVYFDFSENRGIAGFRKYVLGMREDADLPCSVRRDMFWVATLFGFSWFFRVHLSSFTGVHNYTFVKLIDA